MATSIQPTSDVTRTRARGPLAGLVRRAEDIEEARYQSVHVQIWLWTTVACLIGGGLGIALRGMNPITPIWFVFAGCTAAAGTISARWPRYRAAASTTIYVLTLTFSALVFYRETTVPISLAYPGLLAVLTGVAVGEAPRRAFWMGVACLLMVLTFPLAQPAYRNGALFNEAAGAVVTILGLMFCGFIGSILWTRTLSQLKAQVSHNTELNRRLMAASDELEVRVAGRTAELTERSEELRARTAQLRHSLQEQERLKHELAEISVRDELTGLHNRRYFLSQLEALAEQSGTFTMLLIDLDHFKSINDDFGHPTGDQALVAVTRALADAVRTDDIVARIGGEEFAVLLPQTPQPEALYLAEQLRLAVERLTWAPPLDSRTITISIGVAGVVRGEYVVTSKLMTRADKALYQAKLEGRNRVVTDTSRELMMGGRTAL